MQIPQPAGRWIHGILALLLVVFLGRIALTWRVFNDTADEQGHLTAGLEVLETRRYTFEAQHPPLARVGVAALPYFRAGLRRHAYWLWDRDGAWSRREIAYYWYTLTLARAGNLVFAVALLGLVWRWSSLLYGPTAGLVGVLVASCCPNLLAHSGLATLDIAGAATVFATAFFLWRWSEQPGWRYALAAGAAGGLAVLSKFSALVFLPALGVCYILAAPRPRPRVLPAVVGLLLAALVVWAGYGCTVGAIVPQPGHRYLSRFPMGGESSASHRLAKLVEARTLPAPRFWQGLIDLAAHNQQGHPAYLLGRHAQHGWWYYFPVALGLKTTLPLLLLVALALGRGVRRRDTRRWIYPGAAVAIILAVSMVSHINIGIRHVLALFPFFAVLVAGLFTRFQINRAHLAVAALLAWHVGESVAAHPDYLAYFNPIARGREERFLADSNLDWGQDLARLARYLREHRIDRVQLSFWGPANPGKLGVPATPYTGQPGWVAVSVNHLLGVDADAAPFAALRGVSPHAHIGKSLRLYYLPPPEGDRP